MRFIGEDGWAAPRLKDALLKPAQMEAAWAQVARLLRRLDRFRATAVPVVRPEGCEPVRVPNSRWGAGFRGVSWQPCDGPMTPPGLAEVASAGRERRGEDLFVLVRGSGAASPSGRLESVA